MLFAWIRDHLGAHQKEEDVLPPHPEPFEKLSAEEQEQHRKEITKREATLRALEAKARVKGKRW